MALTLADRVKETTTTTGTGTIDLDGAAGKHQTFVSGVGGGSTTLYAIVHQSADEWEVGEGTVNDASPDTLSRDTVLDSTNGGSKVSFSAGTKDVLQTFAADRVVLTDVAVETDVNETITGAWTFNADVTLGMAGGQDYAFVEDTAVGRVVGFKSQSAGTPFNLWFAPKDADGTDDVSLDLSALGDGPFGTNAEALRIRYNSGSGRYEIRTFAAGTGSQHPIHIFGDGSSPNQIVARTDGNVAISGPLKVGGTGAPDSQAGIEVAGNNNRVVFAGGGRVGDNGGTGLLLTAGTSSGIEFFSNDFSVRWAKFEAGALHIQTPNAATGTTLVTAGSGLNEIKRDSSTRRHKTDIEVAKIDPARVLAIDPVTYNRDGSPEIGFIAEDFEQGVLAHGLGYDEQGRVHGFLAGSRVIDAAQQVVLQDHEARLQALEEKIQ